NLETQFLDGKEYAAAAPNLLLVRRPIDEFTVEAIQMVKGVGGDHSGLGVYARNTQVFSSDGKTLTLTFRTFNQQGQEIVNAALVLDKVSRETGSGLPR